MGVAPGGAAIRGGGCEGGSTGACLLRGDEVSCGAANGPRRRSDQPRRSAHLHEGRARAERDRRRPGAGVPKSAVSKSLTRLEEGPRGEELLERSSRRMALTKAGALLVPRAEGLLGEAESLARSLSDERSEQRGLVRVTATPDSGAYFVEQVVPVLARHHPGIRIAVTMGYDIEDLLDPAIDLGIRVGSVVDERLVAHRIARFRLIAVASHDYLASHPVRRGCRISPGVLASCSRRQRRPGRSGRSLRATSPRKVTPSRRRNVRPELHGALARGQGRARRRVGAGAPREGVGAPRRPRAGAAGVGVTRDPPLRRAPGRPRRRVARVAVVLRAARAHSWFPR